MKSSVKIKVNVQMITLSASYRNPPSAKENLSSSQR
jgi:hypothetical protein